MGIVIPSSDSTPDGIVFRWTGMVGHPLLEDCDVGEEIEVSSYIERSVQLSGPWNTGNRFALDFNSDPANMPWFSIIPVAPMLLITPGRPYAATTQSVWPNARFFRPRIASVYQHAGAAIDVMLFCMNRVA